MLLRLAKYSVQVKYVGAKSVLLGDTLSRLVKSRKDEEVPGLDVTIAQLLKNVPTRLESLQGETRSDPTLQELGDYIRTGWPNSMQDLAEILRPYWCFRDELAILDGLIMKGNRVIVPAAIRAETLKCLHDAHQGLTSMLQRARRMVYWPKMQDDITDTINRCQECQIHAKKKPRPPQRQVSASRPSQMLGVDLMDLRGQTALITIDFYSGYITYDPIKGESIDHAVEALNNSFQKLGLVEEIYSDNGPCFKSTKFAQFCQDMEISHQTSSPHFHQSMGRVERAIQTIKQIVKKSQTIQEITHGIITYHDTPISDLLPSPAELFFDRRINSRLGLMCAPSQMTDQQKTQLVEQRAAHPKSSKPGQDNYTTNQPIWFTEDGSPEWRPGFIESQDPHPDSYWIINEKNRRIRRNRYDIKPIYSGTHFEKTTLPRQPELDQAPAWIFRPPPPAVPPEPVHNTSYPPTADPEADETRELQVDEPATATIPDEQEYTTPSGRKVENNRRSDFVYAAE